MSYGAKHRLGNTLAPREKEFLQQAYKEAEISLKEGGVPVGAVLVIDEKVVARGHNKRVQETSMIKHGETDCLENTKRCIKPADMQRATLYTTLSPCFMCAGAVLNNKIPCVVIGENLNFQESESLLRDKGVTLKVAQDEQCIQIMKIFINSNPKLWGEDIGLTQEQIESE